MSDIPASSHPGTLSPRNVDTVSYRVVQIIDKLPLGVGETFSAWAQGEVFACVSGLGLGIIKNGEIEDWEAAGLIVREKPLTPAQERARDAERRAAATTHAAEVEPAPGGAGSRPWTLPGAVAAAGAK